jgi:hypothetical protein
MSNVVQWTSSGTYTTVVTSGQLSGLTTGTGVVSTASISNNKDQYAHFELQVTATGAFASGDRFDIYFLVAPDGTNFEDGGASVTPARAADLIIPVRAVTNTSQRINIKHVPLPQGTFNTLIINQASDPISTGSSILSYFPYNEQITTA